MDFFILITWLPENILILLWEIRCWSILETQGSKKWCPVISDQYCRFFTGKHLFIPTCLIDKESCSLIEQSKTYTGQANLRASCPKRGQEFNFLFARDTSLQCTGNPYPSSCSTASLSAKLFSSLVSSSSSFWSTKQIHQLKESSVPDLTKLSIYNYVDLQYPKQRQILPENYMYMEIQDCCWTQQVHTCYPTGFAAD